MAKQLEAKKVRHGRVADRMVRRRPEVWAEALGYTPATVAHVRLEEEVKLPVKGATKIRDAVIAWPMTIPGFHGQAHLMLFGKNRKTDTFAVIASDIVLDILREQPGFEVG